MKFKMSRANFFWWYYFIILIVIALSMLAIEQTYPIVGIFLISTPFFDINLYGFIVPAIFIVLSTIILFQKRAFAELKIGVGAFIITILGILIDNLYARNWFFSNIGIIGSFAGAVTMIIGFAVIEKIKGGFVIRICWMGFFILFADFIADISLSIYSTILLNKAMAVGGGGLTDGLMIVLYLIIIISILWEYFGKQVLPSKSQVKYLLI
jgi:hypothetical protein